jgi:hypothetical protein
MAQLYLTTPNFFALDKRQWMQRWHNPAERGNMVFVIGLAK